MEYIAVLLLLLILAAALMPAVYALRRRLAMPATKLEFWRVLRRRGLGPAEAGAEPRELAAALRRCTLCPSVDQCERWLALDARERLEEFCPNAAYLRKLERS